jgi:tetratricopeptide (TPR) repeat protein
MSRNFLMSWTLLNLAVIRMYARLPPQSPSGCGLWRRHLAPLLLALAWTGTAGAQAASADALELDRALQKLKEETVLLSRDLQRVEQLVLYPDQSRASIYVNVRVGGFLLESITVRIDEGEPLSYEYSDSEARALLRDGWHRLAQLRLNPGSYRLRAEFTGRFYDARPAEAPIRGKLETVVEKGLSDVDWILPISRNTRLDKPGLPEVARLEARKLRPARNVWLPQPRRFESALQSEQLGSEDDPRFRSAMFLRHDNRFYSALVELLDMAQDMPDPSALSPAYYWLLAECYLAFGMHGPAESLYRQLADTATDPLDVHRAHLRLAEFDYQRGYFPQAAHRLKQIGESLPRPLLDEWRQIYTGALLAQGRYREVIDLLTFGNEADRLPPAQQYNLAVALIRDGRVDEGRARLNRVGTADARDMETLALRDKANLTLGYQYLQAQQGHRAKTMFGRVRVEGPYSNRALLGLGWAELVPLLDGEDPADAPAEESGGSLWSLLRQALFDRDKKDTGMQVRAESASGLSPQEQQALMRALVPWVELARRDPMDPAVQEGLLAIPWALDRLHAFQQSLEHYLKAIDALELARQRMDEAAQSIRGGRMVETIVRRDLHAETGWMWRLRDLPDAPETYFLQSLLAEHRFQEAIKNYRDARLLAIRLDHWRQRLDELERGAPAIEKAPVERQMSRARQTWQPAWAGTVIWLQFSSALAAPGVYDVPPPSPALAPLDLRTAGAPEQFEGTLQQIQPVRDRLRMLQPRIREASRAQNALLGEVSTHELQGQKTQIERYLTEARFAVARIYDRQQKGAR